MITKFNRCIAVTAVNRSDIASMNSPPLRTQGGWRHLITGLAALALAALSGIPAAQAADGPRAIGLTNDGRLVRFSVGAPGDVQNIGFVSGLDGADSTLVGIDFRVQDRRLYGVGNRGGIFRINTQTAVATRVATLNVPGTPVNFTDKAVGVDFNPAANALRIVTANGQNLRMPFPSIPPAAPNPAAFTTSVDTALAYPLPPPVGTVPATGVTAAAYTNNDLDTSTGTTLFDIDTANVGGATDPQDVVAVQSPANAGSLVATGSLGIDAGRVAGFDIFSELRNGVAVSNRGFASLSVGGNNRLVEINLLTGKALSRGLFGDQVIDFALILDK